MSITWQGVFPAVTTQFHSNGALDLPGTARHIEALIAAGVQGLVMLGSLGENTAHEPHEKLAVMEMALGVTGGRVPVLSGVAECTTALACRYAGECRRLGADGLMLLPGMVYRSDPRETVTHFRTVARSVDLPILCYNNPIAYGVDITPEMFMELARERNLEAIKESSGDTRRFTDLFNTVGERYALFAGVDDLIMECTLLGAVGWIAGAGLALPAENQHLWNLMMAGRWDEARAVYRWMMPVLHLDVGPKFIQKIKLAVQEAGLGAEWVRAPRLPLEGAERAATIGAIQKALGSKPALAAEV